MMNASDLWEDALVHIRKNISQTGFSTAFIKVKPAYIEDDTLFLKVSHELYRSMLDIYLDKIREALLIITNKNMNIEVLVEEEIEDAPDIIKNYASKENILNPKFTFDNFIVGSNNEFACAAAYAVAQGPVRDTYNPLLLYGGSGLGKTHLLHAVGNAILEKDSTKKILYVTAEKFMNSFIDAIRNENNRDFRDKFRTIDVLLLDDIQFFAGKEGTQEEFFHTFNELINCNKQIMLTSDRPPKDIYPLEERLRTRLSGGLMTDLQPPDYETRLAILHSKAKSNDYSNEISEEIFNLVAQQIKSNIRELEGAIRTIIAFSDISKKDIDVDTANRILKDYFSSSQKRKIDADYIIKEVEKYYNLNDDVIKSKKRDKEFAYPRQVAMYICRELTQLSLPEIGKEFGGRDHSTVMYGINKIKTKMEKDLNTMHTIKDLIKNIKSDDE